MCLCDVVFIWIQVSVYASVCVGGGVAVGRGGLW